MAENLGTLEYLLRINSEQAEKDLKTIEKAVKDQSGRVEKVFTKYGETISKNGFESLKKKLASLKAQYETLSLSGKGDTAVAKKKLAEIQQIETAVRQLNDAYKAQETAIKATEAAAKKAAAEQEKSRTSLFNQRIKEGIKEEADAVKAKAAADKKAAADEEKANAKLKKSRDSLFNQRIKQGIEEQKQIDKNIALTKKQQESDKEALNAQRSRALIAAENKKLREKEIADKKKVTAATRAQLKLDKQLFAQQKLQAAVAATAAGSIGRLRAEYALMSFQLRNISKDTPDATTKIRQLTAAMAQHRQTIASLAPTEGIFGKLKRAILTYVTAYLSVQGAIASARAFFKQTKELDQLNFSMATVIRSSTELAQTQEFLSKTALAYGGDLLVLSERYVKFRAAAMQSNISAKETQEIYDSVSKAAGTLGLKTDELTGVYLALEQMISKGKVTTEELRRQLGERLPGAFGIMANALGVTIPKLDEMLKKGEVLSKDALPKFAAALEKAYGIESLEKIDNLAAAQGRLATNITGLIKGFEASGSFKNFFNAMAKFVKLLGDNVGLVVGFLKAIISLAAGLAVLRLAMGSQVLIQRVSYAVTGRQIVRLRQLSAAQALAAKTAYAASKATTLWSRALQFFGGGIGLAIAAITAVVTALLLFNKSTEETVDEMQQFDEQQQRLVRNLRYSQSVLNEGNASVKRYNNALQDINTVLLAHNKELITKDDTQRRINEASETAIDLTKQEILQKKKLLEVDRANSNVQEATSPFEDVVAKTFSEEKLGAAAALDAIEKVYEGVRKGTDRADLFKEVFGKSIYGFGSKDLKEEFENTYIAYDLFLAKMAKIEEDYKGVADEDAVIGVDIEELKKKIAGAKDEFDRLAKLTSVGGTLAEPNFSEGVKNELEYLKSLKTNPDYIGSMKALELIDLRISELGKDEGGGKTFAEIQEEKLKAQIAVVNELKKAYDDLTKIVGGGLAGQQLEEIFGERVGALGFDIDYELTDEKFNAWGKSTIEAGNKLGKEVGENISASVSKAMGKNLVGSATDKFKDVLKGFDTALEEYEQKQSLRESIFKITGDDDLAIKFAFDDDDFLSSTDFIKNEIVGLANYLGQQDFFEGTYESLIANLSRFTPELQKAISNVQQILADKQEAMVLDSLKVMYASIAEGQGVEFDFSGIAKGLEKALREIDISTAALLTDESKAKFGLDEAEIERLKNVQINAANEVAKNAVEKLGKDYIKNSLPEQLVNDFEDLQHASGRSLKLIVASIEDMQSKFISDEALGNLFEMFDLDGLDTILESLKESDDLDSFLEQVKDLQTEINSIDATAKQADIGGNIISKEELDRLTIVAAIMEKFGYNFKVAGQEVQRTDFENSVKNVKELSKELSGVFSDMGNDIAASIASSIGEVADSIENIKTGDGVQRITGIIGLIQTIGIRIKGIFESIESKNIDLQAETNRGIAQRITFENEINKLYYERVQIQNESLLLGTDYGKTMAAAAKEMGVEGDALQSTMIELLNNAVFTTEGIGDRLLFGTKSKDFSFTIDEILAGIIPDTYNSILGVTEGGLANIFEGDFFGIRELDYSLIDNLKQILDPLGLFGGAAESKAKADAFIKIQEGFTGAMAALGISAEQLADITAEQLVDLFNLMDKAGYILDQGSKDMLALANEQLAAYLEAQETMKEVISEIAGNLGGELSDALVDAFKNGTDAAEAFKVSVTQVIEDLVANKLLNALFSEDFDKLEQQMLDSYDPLTGDFNLSDDLADFFDAVVPKIDAYDKALAEAQELGKERGFDLFAAGDTSASGISGEIQGIQEDTARRLEGLLNSVREVSVGSNGYLSRLAESNEMIQGYAGQSLTHLASIDSNTKGQLDLLTNLLVASGTQGGKGLKVYVG